MDIRIGTFDYKMEEKEEAILDNCYQCDGRISFNDLTIELNGKLNKQKLNRALCHEIVHGIINEYGIDIGNADLEYLVDTMAIGMLQVIKDNPELIDYIREVN